MSIEGNHSIERYIVFQCRHMDDCGGWGDRLAGLAGAAMLAVTTGRKLRIDWPGLDKVVTATAATGATEALQLGDVTGTGT